MLIIFFLTHSKSFFFFLIFFFYGSMMASSYLHVHILHKVLPHSTILLRSGSILFMWVVWQPHQKCGLSVGGPSPREVHNLSALPCDDRMSV
jgi:hypothetical protein